MTALIDADSIIYILAWQFRLSEESPEYAANEVMEGAVDEFVKGILLACQADRYVGAIQAIESGKCFRYERAKYKPYKANRGEKQEQVKYWEKCIKHRLLEHWGFISCINIEADDIISLAAEKLLAMEEQFVVCSPDKDLKQIAGRHFDYKKTEFLDVNDRQADRNFWYQMLVGDGTDGIAGLPGCGPVNAKKYLDATEGTEMFYEQVVKSQYLKYFGNHYGVIIFEENFDLLSLVTTKHRFYEPSMSILLQDSLKAA